MLETFVRTLCAVEQKLRKGKTSESLLLHEGIPPASKERSAMSTVSIVDNMMNLMKGVDGGRGDVMRRKHITMRGEGNESHDSRRR